MEHPLVFEARKAIYRTLLKVPTSSKLWADTVNDVAEMCDKCLETDGDDEEIKGIVDAYLKRYKVQVEAPSRRKVPASAQRKAKAAGKPRSKRR